MKTAYHSSALIVYAKYPTPGKVKTRLAASIGDDLSAQIYTCFITQILLSQVQSSLGYQIIVDLTPANKLAEFKTKFPGADQYWIQKASVDLGERLIASVKQAFESGLEKIVIIGSDSPTLPVDIVKSAFQSLDDSEVVIGPSEDGGYYLIGMKTPAIDLFRDIRWSSEFTFSDTLCKIKQSSLKCKMLPTWYDIDSLADLQRLIKEHPEFPIPEKKHIIQKLK